MTLSLIYGTVIGLLLGLAWCYWKQIKVAQQNSGLIQSGSNLYNSASDFINQVGQKL